MATSINTEKQCRCILLLTKAGREMLRGIVRESVSESGSSLDCFLQAQYYRITRDRVRITRWAEDVLFPPDRKGTDINKWELNVLCFIVLNVCTLVGNLHQKIIENVKDLKKMRDKLFHAADMTDDKYDQCAVRIENKVITSCKELKNAALLTRVEGIVESIKHDPLSLGDISKILEAWKNTDMRVLAEIYGLHDDHKEIIAYQKENLAESKKLIADHEEVKQQLAFLVKQAGSNPKPPALQFEIQIKDSQKESEVTDILVEMANDYRQKQMKVQHTESSTQVKRSSPDDGHDEEHKSSKATGVNTIKKRKIQMKEKNSEKSSKTNVSVQPTNSPESKEPGRKYVKQAFELVLNEFCKDGTVIVKCDKGSVHLVFQCVSIASLMNKITECLEGKTTTLFIPVQTTLRQLKGCEQICIDVILMKTCYWECIKQTVDCVEESINAAPQTVASSVENVSPEAEDRSNHEKLYISVQSAASDSALEDMRKRCCSVEMMKKLTRLTEAIKNHFEIKNLALEIKVHKVPLLDSDEGVVVSTSPTSPMETVSNSEQPPLVYTSTTSTSLPMVTIATDSDSSDSDSNSGQPPLVYTPTTSTSLPVVTIATDSESIDSDSRPFYSSSSMLEAVEGKSSSPITSASRDDNRTSSQDTYSQSAESSSSMFEIVRGKTDRPRSSASRDDNQTSIQDTHSQSAESSSSMFEIVRGKTDPPRSSASRDDNRASSREPHSQSAESSSSLFHSVGGTFYRPHRLSQTAVRPSETGFMRDPYVKLSRDEYISKEHEVSSSSRRSEL